MRDTLRAGAAGVHNVRCTEYTVRADQHVVTVRPLSASGDSPIYRAECACGWKGEQRHKKDDARTEGVVHAREKWRAAR